MDLKKMVVEFIGTMLLVCTIGLVTTGFGSSSVVAPIAVGAILIALVYAGGHVSGAHYNPAVTLASVLRGNFSWMEAVGYWVAQLAGSVVGGLVVCSQKGCGNATPFAVPIPVIIAEALFTFALVWVVLNVATTPKNSGNGFYGIAIGSTVIAGAYAVGSISGGAFNPAVAVGLGVMNLIDFGSIWMHLVGEIFGAVLATFTYTFVSGKEQ